MVLTYFPHSSARESKCYVAQGKTSSNSMRDSQWSHAFNKFLEEPIGVHEHGKMTAGNRDKFFVGRFHGRDVLAGEGRRSRKILLALKNKHRKGKLQAKLCRAQGLGLRDEHVCKDLAIEVVVEILNRASGSHESEPRCPVEKLVGAFKFVRPLALHAVAFAALVRRRADALQFLDGLLGSGCLRLPQERVIGRRIIFGFVRNLAGAHIGVEELRLCSNHSELKNRAEGMADDDDFVFAKMLPQILGQFDTVLVHASNRHGRCDGFAGLSERSARTPLVPLHYREVLFPRSEECEGPGISNIARTAVEKQQHGIA